MRGGVCPGMGEERRRWGRGGAAWVWEGEGQDGDQGGGL